MRPLQRFGSTEILLLSGMAAMIAVSLQTVPAVRLAQMVFFMLFAALTGKRVRLLPPLFILLSVVAVNLFSPNGRVLFSLWRLDITYGALRLGLLKGALLVGLVYVSRVSVGPDLRLPGYFGALILKTFAYFEKLTEKWPETRGDLLGRVDALLEEISGDGLKAKGATGTAAGDLEAGGAAGAAAETAADAAPYAAGKDARAAAAGKDAHSGDVSPGGRGRRNVITAVVLVIAGWGPYLTIALARCSLR